MHIVWVVLVAFLVGAKSDRIVLQTKNGKKFYNFFPLRTNLLQFSVNTSNSIYIALSNTYGLKSAYYEIVIGDWNNTKSAIRRDNETSVVEHLGTVITRRMFQDFWISINDKEGSISVGKSHERPFMYYVDPNYVRMSYFGFTTNEYDVEWNFDFEILTPQTGNIHHHNDPRYETIEAN